MHVAQEEKTVCRARQTGGVSGRMGMGAGLLNLQKAGSSSSLATDSGGVLGGVLVVTPRQKAGQERLGNGGLFFTPQYGHLVGSGSDS